ncbi:MAG: hypothetical protein ACRDPC_10685, partial [Solirubrobacteraceae bacterium]
MPVRERPFADDAPLDRLARDGVPAQDRDRASRCFNIRLRALACRLLAGNGTRRRAGARARV